MARTASGAGSRVPMLGTGSAMRWFYVGIWLAYLIQPVTELFAGRHGALYTAGGLALVVAFAATYLPVATSSIRWPRLARWGLLALAALAALGCVVYGKDWTTLWIYVSAAAGMVLPSALPGRRAPMLAVAAVGACYVLFSVLSHDDLSDFLVVLLPVLLVGWAMIGFRAQMDLMRELARAREEVAKMAAGTERLRLARDMHDLTGQSLSMITLKSDLAAKRLARLEPSAGRDAALAELGDIGRVARQTLHDIREAVSGYRRPTLAVEAIAARSALEAAGIGLDDDPALMLRSGGIAPDTESVLAWCLREAVTNVIRHSGARACRVRLAERRGRLSLEVTDDGRGPAAPAAPAGPDGRGEQGAAAGAGLRGMSERLSALGGSLALGTAGPGQGPGEDPGRRGFRLTATVPAPAPAGARPGAGPGRTSRA